MPESHRAQLREDLSGPLRRGLSGLTMTECSELTSPGSKMKWGEESAEWTEVEFTANLDDITAHYESWNADHPGVEPPELPDLLRERFVDRQEEAQQIWAERGWPAQQLAPGREQAYYEGLREELYPDARQQEIADLQRFLGSHTAPSQQSDAQSGTASGAGERDNVRSIGSLRKPERGVE